MLRKLLPKKIEQCVYILHRHQPMPELVMGFDLKDVDIEESYAGHGKWYSHRLSLGGQKAYASKAYERVHFMKLIHEPNAMVIGDCATKEAFRGLSIYPFMLQHVARRMFEKVDKIYVLVSPTNKASVKGIEKAGFYFVCIIYAIRFGPFYFRVRRVEERE